MSFKKFENQAKEKIDGHKTPLNTEALWENVHAELYPEKKKRFAWVWFSASSILAIVLLSSYVYFNKAATNINAEQIASNKTNIQDNQHTKNEMSPASLQMENKTLGAKMKATKPSATNESSNLNSTTKNTSPAQVKKVKKKADFVSAEKETRINALKRNLTPQKLTQQSTLKDAKLEVEKTKTDIKNKISPNPEEQKTKGPQKSKAVEKKNVEPETKKLATNEVETAKDIATEEPKKSAEPLIIEDEREVENDDDEDDDSINRNFKRAFKIGIGARVGASNSLTTLTANTEGGAELRVLRSQSEKNLETIDLGIDVMLKHKSGIYFSTGMDYLKASRKLEFNSEVTTTDSVVGIAKIYVNPITMDTVYEEGVIGRITTTTREKEVYNNLHLISIPLSLGATINYERWAFGIQGGALLNVMVKRKGQIMTGEASFYDWGIDEANWFKDNVGLSFQGGALIGYNFTDNFQIIGGPNFRSKVIVSESINPVQQSQVGLGLQIAARYWFD